MTQDPHTGRTVDVQHTFHCADAFGAISAAQAWLKANGYSAGSPCGAYPIGIKRGADIVVAKWRNLTKTAKAQLDGIILGGLRDGPITVILFTSP